MSQTTLTNFSGFDLAIGSAFAVRWFTVDSEGRLRSRMYDSIWKPGENVAKCRQGDSTWSFPSLSISGGSFTYHLAAPSLSEQAVEARVEVKHDVPADRCGCGFYAFAEGCDDRNYADKRAVVGVVECYGRVILGTKGLRAEKARIVGLAGASKRTKDLYPDVRHFRKEKWMLRAFDLVQPAQRTPETDPTFWGD